MPETNPLLMLAGRHPLRALHVSSGRLERVHIPENGFVGIYIPVGNEYYAVLNEAANEVDQRRVLRMIVGHHTEGHGPNTVCVFGPAQPTCTRCDYEPRIRDADDWHRRATRRLNWG